MDLTSVVVRPLAADDWTTFRRIRLRALTDAPHAFGSTLHSTRQRTEHDWRAALTDRTQFLATADGTDIGTVGAFPEHDEIHLVSMWVAPEARGTGVADLLVRAVIDHADGHEQHRIRLDVTEGNDAAERLYLRHGFRRTGILGVVSPEDPRPEFEMLRTR